MNKLLSVVKVNDNSNFKYKSFILKTLGYTNKQGCRIAKRILLVQALCFKKPTPNNFEFGVDFPLGSIKTFYDPINLDSQEFKREFKQAVKEARTWLAQHQPF